MFTSGFGRDGEICAATICDNSHTAICPPQFNAIVSGIGTVVGWLTMKSSGRGERLHRSVDALSLSKRSVDVPRGLAFVSMGVGRYMCGRYWMKDARERERERMSEARESDMNRDSRMNGNTAARRLASNDHRNRQHRHRRTTRRNDGRAPVILNLAQRHGEITVGNSASVSLTDLSSSK